MCDKLYTRNAALCIIYILLKILRKISTHYAINKYESRFFSLLFSFNIAIINTEVIFKLARKKQETPIMFVTKVPMVSASLFDDIRGDVIIVVSRTTHKLSLSAVCESDQCRSSVPLNGNSEREKASGSSAPRDYLT